MTSTFYNVLCVSGPRDSVDQFISSCESTSKKFCFESRMALDPTKTVSGQWGCSEEAEVTKNWSRGDGPAKGVRIMMIHFKTIGSWPSLWLKHVAEDMVGVNLSHFWCHEDANQCGSNYWSIVGDKHHSTLSRNLSGSKRSALINRFFPFVLVRRASDSPIN